LSRRRPAGIIASRYSRVHRPSALALVAAAVLVAACHQRVRRPAGDELPYPPLDEAAMDRAASPCQDFYQYACGRWVAETPVPADRTSWVRGQGELEERDARLLRRILEDARDGKVDAQDRFGRRVGDFYAACMEEADVEARATAELQAEWARLDAVSDREDLAQSLARLEAMGIAVPFMLRAVPDPSDPRRALLALEADGTGLPGPAHYRAEEPWATARNAYAAHLGAELRLAGLPAVRVEGAVQGALDLERALAEARAPAPGDAPRRVDRAGLERLAPAYPWSALLEAIGAGRRVGLAAADPGFVAAVGRLFEEAPLEAWRDYLRWRLTDAMTAARATTAAMVAERFRFQGTLGPAPAELRPRWKHCVQETGRVFAFAAGTAFGRRHLGLTGRERAAALVSEVEAGMRSAIEGAPWMDAATRARAAHKLERLQVQVGYPDAAPDYDRLRAGRTSYFRNVLSAGRFAVATEVGRAERPVDRAEWVVGPFAAAPAYLADRNTLCVPAGALQPPLFDRDAPDAVQLGAMGVRIGQRLAEVFQGPGRERGAEGERSPWWTAEAGRGFAAAATCLSDQYQAYRTAPGAPPTEGAAGPDPALALSDLAGLRAVLEALRDAQEVAGAPPPRLLGMGAEQQLFLAWAQTLCTARPAPGVAGDDLPARFRVNGPLSNLSEFAKAFRCGEGTPMARPPEARCRAW
jgi:putative endopeptidase